MIVSPPLPAAMIAWQATIKPKVRFISLQIKSSPVSLSLGKYVLSRQESVFVNDSFCDHFTLSLNNRNETTAASGDSAKTFAPPGSGQHSQLPSRVRREVRPRLHYLAATRDLHRPLLIQNIRTSCDHLQREIPFRLQQTEKESNCCADTSGFISPGT